MVSFKRIRSLILACILSLSCCIFYAGAVNAQTSADTIDIGKDPLIPNEKNDKIYEKIDELALAKAAANQYASMYSDSKYDDQYAALLKQIEALRAELDALGAVPSEDIINELLFQNTMSVNGSVIRDFSDFESMFGKVYDIYGITKTVCTDYDTFYCYDVVIQDYTGKQSLASSISQSGSSGYDLYAANSSVVNFIGDDVGNLFFDQTFENTTEGSTLKKWSSAAKTAFPSILGIPDSTAAADAVTQSGTSQSYRIFCDLFPTVHMIFVRNSTSSPWIHTYTTNSVSVVETHTWYMAVCIGGGKGESYSGSKSFKHVLTTENWEERYTPAISAYRENLHKIHQNMVTSYTVAVEVQGKAKEVFTQEVNCPVDQNDLIHYAVNENSHILFIIFVFSLSFLLLITILFVLYKHKRNRFRKCKKNCSETES